MVLSRLPGKVRKRTCCICRKQAQERRGWRQTQAKRGHEVVVNGDSIFCTDHSTSRLYTACIPLHLPFLPFAWVKQAFMPQLPVHKPPFPFLFFPSPPVWVCEPIGEKESYTPKQFIVRPANSANPMIKPDPQQPHAPSTKRAHPAQSFFPIPNQPTLGL